MQCVGRRMVRYRPRLKPYIFRLNATSLRPSIVAGPFSNYPYHKISNRRTTINVSPFLLPPLVFSGLVLALWTWKCSMMILFRNKIIYMPGLPPSARREKISDYINQCGGVMWQEVKIVGTDKTQLALCMVSIQSLREVLVASRPTPVTFVFSRSQNPLSINHGSHQSDHSRECFISASVAPIPLSGPTSS